jgi:hypothetical protein
LHAVQGIHGLRDAVEFHGDGAIAPRIVEYVAAIGREREVQAQATRGIRKYADLITGGGSKKQQVLRHSLYCRLCVHTALS